MVAVWRAARVVGSAKVAQVRENAVYHPTRAYFLCWLAEECRPLLRPPLVA